MKNFPLLCTNPSLVREKGFFIVIHPDKLPMFRSVILNYCKGRIGVTQGGLKMKKRSVAVLMAAFMGIFGITGCAAKTESAQSVVAESSIPETTQNQAGAEENADQKAADEVAAMIDAIYVQERTKDTDKQCADAKAGWDALTDVQKELVAGEYADPDYFGRDTGDASKDDPRNQDGIGENEILVVSFGTSFNNSRVADIKGIEDALQEANPDWSVRRAFTAQIIINHIQARDGEFIDNVDQALERAVKNGVKNLVVQPTHLMRGAEYDELSESVEAYRDKFETVKVAQPLLGEVGKDASKVNEDKKKVAEAITAEAVKTAGYESLGKAKEDGIAFVFMGHGTSHAAKVSYSQMQTQMKELGYDNVFIGTVEGEPEETSCERVIEAASQAGYKKIILRPLMVVAGDHANNDMAGEDEDSWMSMFEASKKFESVEAQIYGMGSVEAIQQIYIAHTAAVMEETEAKQDSALMDGVYTADFHTDSSMFHVNETCQGKGTLTVEDGAMTIHITLTSKNILNLYPGLAQDAKKEGAKLLQPTEDSVTYSDGSSEIVHGFDVPVPALDAEFDLALIGKKGKWYDHKVSVSNPEPISDKTQLTDAALPKDGTYSIELTFEGGSGKAKILSPAAISVRDKKITAVISWSSPNYDYMLVNDEKYLPVNTEGNSVFEIPVEQLDYPVKVIGNTVAMSKPHEIEYTITFHSDTMKPGK